MPVRAIPEETRPDPRPEAAKFFIALLLWAAVLFGFPQRHPFWFFLPALPALGYLLYTVLKNGRRRDSALFFIVLAEITAGASSFYPLFKLLYLPLATGVAAFFGPAVFLPVWASLPLLEARPILAGQYDSVFLVLAAFASGLVAWIAVRRLRARASELRQRVFELRDDPLGAAGDGRAESEKEVRDALEMARQSTGAGAVLLFQADAGELFLKASTCGGATVNPEGLIRLVFKQNQPLFIGNLAGRGQNPGYSHAEEIDSLAALPVLDGTVPIGVLAADSARPGAFSGREHEALAALAGLLSGLLKRQREAGELRREKKRFEIVNEEIENLLHPLELGPIASKAVHAARRILPAMGAALFVFEDGACRLAAVEGLPEPGRKEFKTLRGTLLETAMGNRDIMHLTDLSGYSLPLFPFDCKTLRTAVIRTLVHENEILGVLALASPVKNTLTAYQLELLKLFTNQLSVALANVFLHQRVKRLATTDGLTGLYNHRHFQEKLSEEFRRITRYPNPLSLLLVDIDFFKKINDTYGHPAGDAVLRTMASILSRTVRETDIPARYGGEEFAALLLDTDKKGAAQLAERLRRTIADTLFQAEGRTLRITASIGVASSPEDTRAKEALVDLADKALYRAKHGGRNRVALAE